MLNQALELKLAYAGRGNGCDCALDDVVIKSKMMPQIYLDNGTVVDCVSCDNKTDKITKILENIMFTEQFQNFQECYMLLHLIVEKGVKCTSEELDPVIKRYEEKTGKQVKYLF